MSTWAPSCFGAGAYTTVEGETAACPLSTWTARSILRLSVIPGVAGGGPPPPAPVMTSGADEGPRLGVAFGSRSAISLPHGLGPVGASREWHAHRRRDVPSRRDRSAPRHGQCVAARSL